MTAPESIPAPRPAAPTGVDPFYDCSFSKLEVFVIIPAVVISLAMQCAPVLQSALAMPLIAFLAAICWLSPVTGFFFVACSQSLPFPPDAVLNPTQIGAVIWAPVALIRYRGLRLQGIHLLLVLVPFLLWASIVSWSNILNLQGEFTKALVYAGIGCQLVNEARGRYLKCLLGLCLGAVMVTNAYWGAMLGLPIEINTWGVAREGFARLGGARADSVMLWPPTLMGTYGVIGLAIALSVQRIPRQAAVLRALALVLFLLSIPPLVATMSNAACVGWAMMVLGLFAMLGYLRVHGLLPWHMRRGIVMIAVAMVIAASLLYAFDVLKIHSRMEALRSFYKLQRRELGFMASRTEVWSVSLLTIRKHPLTGRAFALDKEDLPREYPTGYASHNVFLDHARLQGIPATILLACFFFMPFVRLWKRRRFTRYLGFFFAYFAMFLFWMVLSFPYYKTFWSLWMLMAIVATYDGRPFPVPRRRKGVA